MAGLATLMAVWWVFEVVPLYVTALLPLVCFPLFGVAKLSATASAYGKPTIYLFLGGFLLALGLQRSGLHRRIALQIVNAIGSRPTRLVLGFMISTSVLSMWISNTASVMVMMPIGLSLLEEARARGVAEEALGALGAAVMLGIAYAADIGGMATPVGTPPNLVLIETLPQLFPEAPSIGFGQWMLLGVPLYLAFIAGGWWLLSRVLFPFPPGDLLGESEGIREALDALGPVRRDEVVSGGVFALTALLWVSGGDLSLGGVTIPGWRSLLGLPEVGDAAVAIGGAVLLFLLPSKDRPGETLLQWEDAQRGVPWGLLLLFGGGFALADGFKLSGLSESIGGAFVYLRGAPDLLVIAIVCLVLTFLTELTSNTATTALVLPILAQAGVALEIDPRALMIPATLSASCAFMMPVASPTQAIVFGSGYVPLRQMIRCGIWFNLFGVILVTLLFAVLGGGAFGFEAGTLPDWAVPR
jgi:sodium-dependent dicarboxylate transporter 2/3/5